jgi:hypothetical protein
MLNVGQGDTTIIISPEGRVAIIDAMRPPKVRNFLNQLGTDGAIEHLIVTHPHDDHYGACNCLVNNWTINEATLAPFWHAFGLGPKTYSPFIDRMERQGTSINFLSGYSRWYPDDVLMPPLIGEYPIIDPDKPFLELLGPTNDMVRILEEASVFECNHLSIMCRLTWKDFRMIITGDAQMENWAFFDEERLLEDKCQVLQAAHHGSKNGTQWERINRLSPEIIIVSSDPEKGHHLPDLCGSSIFLSYDNEDEKFACLTIDTGTIHIRVSSDDTYVCDMMGDAPTQHINLSIATPLTETANPTNELSLLQYRIDHPE